MVISLSEGRTTPLLNFTKVISLSGGRTTPLLNFTKVISLSGGRTTLSFLNNYLTKTGIIIQLPKIDTFLLLLSHRVILSVSTEDRL